MPLYPDQSPYFYYPKRATGAGSIVDTKHPGQTKEKLEFNSSELCTAIYVALKQIATVRRNRAAVPPSGIA